MSLPESTQRHIAHLCRSAEAAEAAAEVAADMAEDAAEAAGEDDED